MSRKKAQESKPLELPFPQEQLKGIATYIAMAVRNEIENFHSEYLSDGQMRELNPLIRNAIYTALHALSNVGCSEAAREFVKLQTSLVPNYWEEPHLTEDFLGTRMSRL
jgi:hypothetical protein